MTEHEIVTEGETRPDDNRGQGGQPPFWIILAVIVFFALGSARPPFHHPTEAGAEALAGNCPANRRAAVL